jgi:hypothetical protein
MPKYITRGLKITNSETMATLQFYEDLIFRSLDNNTKLEENTIEFAPYLGFRYEFINKNELIEYIRSRFNANEVTYRDEIDYDSNGNQIKVLNVYVKGRKILTFVPTI